MMRLRKRKPPGTTERGMEPKAKGRRVPLARCASVIPRRGTPDATGFASSWQGGSFAPRCIPRTRAFRRWTRPDALRLLDFRPGGVSPSGHPTAVSTAASTRRAFVPSMDLQTGEDFALPPDPHRPGVCRHGPCTRAVRPSTAAGLSRPCPTTNRQAGWMRPSHAIAWGYALPVFCDSDRTGSPGSARKFREPGLVSRGPILKTYAGGTQP
jgi:hypothetical protein